MYKEILLKLYHVMTKLKVSYRFNIMFFCSLVIIGESILIAPNYENPVFKTAVSIRIFHACFALAVLVFLLFKKDLNRKLSLVLFTVVFLPLLFAEWSWHVAKVEEGINFIPFARTQIIYIGLAIIYSGSFLLNAGLMVVLTVMVNILWHKLVKINPHLIPGSGGYYGLLMYAVVCLCLLFYRYIDERTYKLYLAEKIRLEFIENLARMLMNFRDKSNTPIQNLIILLELLKRNQRLSDEQLDSFSKSINLLKDCSDNLTRYEKHVPWSKRPVMTDDEMDHWLRKLEEDIHILKKGE